MEFIKTNLSGEKVWGRSKYLFSAEEKGDVTLGTLTDYDSESERWFAEVRETFGSIIEFTTADFHNYLKKLDFWSEHHGADFRETYYYWQYQDENPEKPDIFYKVTEYLSNFYRTFQFTIRNVNEEQFQDIENALMVWHRTGVLMLGGIEVNLGNLRENSDCDLMKEEDDLNCKFQLDPDWIVKQLNREDSEERVIAFYESFHHAFMSDGEDWYQKGLDALHALLTNDAPALLVALCGYSPNSLAQYTLLKRSTSQFTSLTLDGKLIVEWEDGQRNASPCFIYSKQNQVYGFDHDIFTREDNSAAQIVKTFVRFNPQKTGNEYDFLCVSKEERDRTEDEDIFWYDPDGNEIH